MPDPIDIGLVDPVIKQVLSQPFPQIPAPFVDPKTGVINQIWLQLLIALWQRTGGAPGGSITEITNYSVAIEDGGGGEAIGEAAQDLAQIAAAEADSSPTQPVDAALMTLLLELPSGTGETEPNECCASWVPLVDGAEPPAFITDGAGQLIFVAYGP